MLSKKVNIIINKIYIGVSQILVSLHTYYIFCPAKDRKMLSLSRILKGRFPFYYFKVVAGQVPITVIAQLTVRYGSKRAINHHSHGCR
jgi:hypothetical protein